jgi:hypothetical protein
MNWYGGIRFAWRPALAAAALWLGSAGVYAALSWNSIGPQQVAVHLAPETIPAVVWQWPWPWNLLAPLVSALLVFGGYLLFAALFTSPTASRRSRFIALWFAAVAVGFLATAPWAIALIIAEYPPPRAAFVFNPAADWMRLSAYWGLVWGWLPALVGARRQDPAQERPATSRPHRGLVVLAAAVVLVMVASGASLSAGLRAARFQSAALEAIADGHTLGAVADPDAEVTPPPTRLPAAGTIDPAWCTPEQAMLLLGGKDAATGHRVLTIRTMNFGDAPCALQGYPDVAFSDDNGSEIVVTLGHGSSFMADDPGAREVILPPGGYASAKIGWDAMPTDGELATYTLHAAMYPGLERGSWPVSLDIVAGGDVAVTAWELSDAGAASD